MLEIAQRIKICATQELYGAQVMNAVCADLSLGRSQNSMGGVLRILASFINGFCF